MDQGLKLATPVRQELGSREVGTREVTSAGTTDRGGQVQQRVNDRVWLDGRFVREYANRELRPVEVDILVRYRQELSSRVLELGSGAGRITGYLAKIAQSVHGVDLSAPAVAYSQGHYPRATFSQGDVRDAATYAGGPYGAIVAGFNIVDVLSDAERQALLDRVHNALVPGGLFVMSSHNRATESHLSAPFRITGVRPREVAWRLVRLPRWWRNRRRLLPYEQHEADYAVLNDLGHDYSVLHYYISRDAQERQLADHGFELVECLDLDGAKVDPGEPAAHSSELHYVAKRVG